MISKAPKNPIIIVTGKKDEGNSGTIVKLASRWKPDPRGPGLNNASRCVVIVVNLWME